MANKTISDLDTAQSLDNSMVIPVELNGNTYKAFLGDIKSYCLPTGTINITANGTYYVADYSTASVLVEPTIEPLSITPSTSSQTITAPSGTDGYSPISVAAVTSSIDANIVAGNIKDGVSILGVTGTYSGTTPTGTLSITANGVYDVTNYASADVSVSGGGSKFGANINTFLGDVDANGVLQEPTEQSDLVFIGVTDVADYGLYYKFARTKVKSVSFPALTTISGSSGCSFMLQYCTALTSVSLPALTTISGNSGCSNMLYRCTALTSISFPALTTISGSNGCIFMLGYCTALTDAYFPALTTISFGSRINQFTSMMSGTGTTTTHTLHFPSNLQSTIAGLTGYPLFGGTSGYVVCAFDLPSTS